MKNKGLSKSFLKKATAAGMAMSMTMLSIGMPSAYAASSHGKIAEGIYQLRDGTAVPGILARGIDVSHWQGDIDWGQVAQNDVSFVMLGTRYKGEVDPLFHKNATEALQAGIQLGIYIYSYATDVAMAEAEADFVLDLIKDYPISYPVAFDMEADVQSSLSPDELSAMVNAFCRKIEDAGYHPILYANDYWLANKIDMSQVKYDVWVARYERKHAYENPVMWQASSTGAIDGIAGNVDIDFQYVDFSDVIIPNLWRTIGGKTYYYQDYAMQKDTWIHDGTGWFFMEPDGQAASGWLTQGGATYYLDPVSRRMAVGWLLDQDGWRYFNSSGAMQTGWIHDGAAWYYLNESALMQTGWLQDGDTWYYLQDSGSMVNGWNMIHGLWYYFDGSGAMQTGLQQINSHWYYLDGSGAMQAGLQQIDGSWYYFDHSGAMQTGTQQIDGSWYYFDGSGAMQTGLQQIGGHWYYYGSDGKMLTGWQFVENNWYFFDGSGVMQTGWVGEEPARYYLNPENGIMYANTQIVVDGVTYQVDGNGICTAIAAKGPENTDSENDMQNTDGLGNSGVIEVPPFAG